MDGGVMGKILLYVALAVAFLFVVVRVEADEEE